MTAHHHDHARHDGNHAAVGDDEAAMAELLDLDATLVSDAHTTEDRTAWGAPPPDQVIAHTNLSWTYHTAPGRTAGTVKTEDVDFGVPY